MAVNGTHSVFLPSAVPDTFGPIRLWFLMAQTVSSQTDTGPRPGACRPLLQASSNALKGKEFCRDRRKSQDFCCSRRRYWRIRTV